MSGLLSILARHRTAPILLMLLMIVGGIYSLSRMTTQFFPDFGIDVVTISVAWPGASAEDVDSTIVQAIEPEVRFLDGVDSVRSFSFEDLGSMTIEFLPGSDMQQALSDVESALAQVTTLPEDSERPVVRRVVRYDTIMRLLVSGPYPERSLKAFAKRIRDDLLARGVDKVTLQGNREEEVSVEIAPETLRRLDLTLGEIAQKIRETSVDLPLGTISGATERQIRARGKLTEAADFGNLEIKSSGEGQKIYLDQIARVADDFDPDDVELRRFGNAAIDINVQRALSNDALELAAVVDEYLKTEVPTFPANLKIEKHDVAVDLIESRIDLLLRNGAGGLVLVLLVLFIFLNGRVAFWVAVGIPVSIMAAMIFMWGSGQSINMVSLFGLIMVIGIVVDDAIVVGEHIEHLHRSGMSALDATLGGIKRMAAPVTSASLTTMAAFLPLLVISDVIGQIIAAIPMVVISVVAASLFESFFVLPGHLYHSLVKPRWLPTVVLEDWLRLPHVTHSYASFRQGFDRRFNEFRDGTFRTWVRRAVDWRYSTIAAAFGALILAVGLVGINRVGFTFFPSPEADRVFANFELAVGVPRKQSILMLEEMERALNHVEMELTDGEGGLVHIAISNIGGAVSQRRLANSSNGDNLGGMIVELVPSDAREIRNETLIDAWREAIEPVEGLVSLSILSAQTGPPGRGIHVDLTGADASDLKLAAEELKSYLASIPAASDLTDNLPYGKPEVILDLTPQGKAMGFTTTSVATQVRDAFEGAIATRFPRGDEEVLVRVQFAEDETGTTAFDTLYLRSPGGVEVPLSEIVRVTERPGVALVFREDGTKRVSVTGELDTSRANLNEVLDAVESDVLPLLEAKYGVRYEFGGKALEQSRTFNDMRWGAMMALALIYIVLAWIFASYTRPIVVMSIIPFGFIGAALGHLFLGFDLTILSMVALIGLSGIVVNDSIILVTTIIRRADEGTPIFDAIVDGTCERLRAVILTSATTIGGLTPLLFETSLQAQFLIPMAVTIVFGLMGTTLLVLFLVPAMLGMFADISNLFRYFRNLFAKAPA